MLTEDKEYYILKPADSETLLVLSCPTHIVQIVVNSSGFSFTCLLYEHFQNQPQGFSYHKAEMAFGKQNKVTQKKFNEHLEKFRNNEMLKKNFYLFYEAN